MLKRLTPHRHHLFPIAIFTALTLIFTYPLIAQLNTHVLGAPKYDNFEYIWKMWWVPHAIFERGISPFFNPDVYVPFGYSLAYGEITPIHTFGMIPFTLLFGEIVSYNLISLGSFILTGWATYALTYRWLEHLPTKPDQNLTFIAALFSGAAFSFCAYRMMKLQGHLPLFDTQWLVLTLWVFDLWLEKQQARYAALSGLFLSLAALSSWYYAFMLVLLLPVYTVFRVPDIRQFLSQRRIYVGLIVAGIITAVLCIPFLIPYLQLDAEGATSVPLSDARLWAASFTDYFIPNPMHPVWGAWVRPLIWPFPSPLMTEFNVSIGWVTLIFAVFAWRHTAGKRWRGLKSLIVLAFVLSLGPYMSISRLPIDIPLPVLLLRLVVPFADSMRSWGRFSVFVMLGCSILAGAGLSIGLKDLKPRPRNILAVCFLMLMLFGTWIGPYPQTPIEPRPVDIWLAAQLDDSPIMEYPLSEALSGAAMLYTRYHEKPVVFGYGTYLPLLYRQRHPELLNFPDENALDQLAEWGVHYILITQTSLSDQPFTLAEVDAQPRLEHVITLDDVAVYALNPT